MSPTAPANRNLRRRLLPGLLAVTATPLIRPLLRLLRGGKRRGDRGEEVGDSKVPVLVFSSYMVGDLFMALPALKRLAEATDIRVLCRPDCVILLEREGVQAIPFDNAFFTRRTPAAFWRTLRAAWRLRSLPPLRKDLALDLDADPRTALWLAIAGCARIESYRRPYGSLFDATFTLPVSAVHQADRDLAVVGEFLRLHGAELSARPSVAEIAARENAPGTETDPSAPWILSVWTRKTAKNWPLGHWDELVEDLLERSVSFAVLQPPDGDSAFQLFRARWASRIPFIEGSLEQVADRVRHCAGVIATDNFLGHMAGYYGKPVLWINRVSPAEQVQPRGPHTVRVGNGEPGRPETPTVRAVREAFEKIRVSGAPASR